METESETGKSMQETEHNTADEARQKRYIYMTQTPIPRLIRDLSIPTIISMLVSGLYNMADTFFVGKLSTQATAAVGIVFSIMAIIQAVGFFCGHGSGNYMSRKLGAGDIKEASEMAATGFILAFILGGLILVLGIVFLKPLSVFLGATPAMLQETQDYMRIVLIGAPYMTAQLVINNQLRFQGSAMYAMVGLVAGAVLNIGMDPLFIFTFGMGVSGAALATILSQFISFCILFAGSQKGANIRIKLKNVHFSRHYMLQIVNGGTPSLCRQGLNSIATIIMNTMAGSLGGVAAIAGMSIVTRVMLLANSALIGFGQGFQPVCAFNYGADLKERVRKSFWFCVKYGTIFLIFMAVLCGIFSTEIITFFRKDPDVIAVGSVALRVQALVFPLNAFIVMANMMLQSIGKGVKASILAASRSGLFFIPFILILSYAFGLFGVEITQTCSDVCTFAISIPMVVSELRKMKSGNKK